jgi:CYTH domain-containing protein
MASTSITLVNAEFCQDCNEVPLPASSDKLHEAMYFYARMQETYHEPEWFRYNLNAFIQSQRSVEDVIEREMKRLRIASWKPWFEGAKKRLKHNQLLGKFHGLRNFVVHEGMLQAKSRAIVGMFRYRKQKLGFVFEVDPFTDSRLLLQHAVETMSNDPENMFVHPDHHFIGEEMGVERSWVVAELGPKDVTDYCRESFVATQCVTQQAVGLAGGWLGSHDLPGADRVRLLTETDLDPSLIEKWGW